MYGRASGAEEMNAAVTFTQAQLHAVTEQQMQMQIEAICKKLKLELSERQYRIGKFRLDATARDTKTNALAVIELKSCMRTDALGQLLLYRRALKAKTDKCVARSILVSTYIDKGLIFVVNDLALSGQGIELWQYEPRQESDFGLHRVFPDRRESYCDRPGIWDQADPTAR